MSRKKELMKAFRRLNPRGVLAYSGAYRKLRTLVQSKNSASRLVSDFLKIHPGQRVLDIGCGTGDILAQLPHDMDYHGYDIDPGYIASARKRYGHRGSFVVRSVSLEAMDGLGTFDVYTPSRVTKRSANKVSASESVRFRDAKSDCFAKLRAVPTSLSGVTIKTAAGLQWLTIPVLSKGRYEQPIDEVEIARPWTEKHWRAREFAYRRAPFFESLAPTVRGWYERADREKRLAPSNLPFPCSISSSTSARMPRATSTRARVDGADGPRCGMPRIVLWTLHEAGPRSDKFRMVPADDILV